jgi:hypothetical protein
MSSTTLNIHIAPTKRTQRGQLYEVRLGASDGRRIVERSLDPEHASCRYLAEQGLGGRLEVWSPGRTTPRMIIRCIETAARLSASEEDRKGVRLRKYQPPLSARASAEEDSPAILISEDASNDNAPPGANEKAG